MARATLVSPDGKQEELPSEDDLDLPDFDQEESDESLPDESPDEETSEDESDQSSDEKNNARQSTPKDDVSAGNSNAQASVKPEEPKTDETPVPRPPQQNLTGGINQLIEKLAKDEELENSLWKVKETLNEKELMIQKLTEEKRDLEEALNQARQGNDNRQQYLQGVIDELKGYLKSKNDKLRQLQDFMQKKNEEHEKQKQELQRQLQQKHAEIQEYDKEKRSVMAVFNKERMQDKQAIKDKDFKIEKLQKEAAIKEDYLKELRRELELRNNDFNKRIEIFHKQLEKKDEKIQNIEEEKKRFIYTVSQKDLGDKKKFYRLQETISQLNDTIKEKDKTIELFRNELQAWEQAVQKRDTKMRDMVYEIKRLNKTIANMASYQAKETRYVEEPVKKDEVKQMPSIPEEKNLSNSEKLNNKVASVAPLGDKESSSALFEVSAMVQNALERGDSPDSIKNSLQNSGYSKELIESAFDKAK